MIFFTLHFVLQQQTRLKGDGSHVENMASSSSNGEGVEGCAGYTPSDGNSEQARDIPRNLVMPKSLTLPVLAYTEASSVCRPILG